jgi:hypothetical protein
MPVISGSDIDILPKLGGRLVGGLRKRQIIGGVYTSQDS